MAKLGYIGLGVMGGQMVDRLLDKGHTVTGYNRTKSKAQWLIDKGMKWADTPAAVCTASDVILSMVTNSGALTEVAEGPNGVLSGIGAGFSMGFGSYASMPLPLMMAATWFIGTVIKSVLAGAVLGAVVKQN